MEQGQSAQRLGFERACRVIDQWEPESARELTRVVKTVIRYPGVTDWSHGLLNRDGAPVEFSFSTMTNQLRYTLELNAAGVPPQQRLSLVGSLLAELGLTTGWSGAPRMFQELQTGGQVEWGAWLGIRHALRPDPENMDG